MSNSITALLKPEIIKRNIKKNLNIRGWTVAELERKIGDDQISKKSIGNIFRKDYKYPTIDLLNKIAKAFGIEISQLLIDDYIDPADKPNFNLLNESFTKVTKYFENNREKLKVSVEQIFFISKEVYNYCQKLKVDTVDTKFIEWVTGRYITQN